MSHSSISFGKELVYPVMGGVAMGVGSVAYFFLLEKLHVSIIMLLTLFYLRVTVILSVVFLHEQLKLVHVAGIILMMIASLLLSL